MNKTNFIKHLEDNYKNYNWAFENSSVCTTNNGVRIKIEQPTTISYSIQVAGKYNFNVYSSNDMYEEFNKLYNNISDFIQYNHDNYMEMWMERFVKGDNNDAN